MGEARVGVVLPAGGSGLRMGGEAKQFRRLGDAPVLVQSLRAFARHPEVGPAVVVVPDGEEGPTASMLSAFDIQAAVVAGGATRQASVANGVAALPEAVSFVLVHDAVRPFVSADVISRVVAAVREVGAAAAAVPVADTLRRGDGDRFEATVDREGLWAMQTPQAARRDWLLAASALGGEVATDEVGLLQAAGHTVRIVEGDSRNLKITRRPDWDLALALWPAWAEGR
ncbi:MAG: 2-C-methyl-D-erythritol 4-phosphate cytidylyltransferase [Bacteroidota bacterium]